MELPVAESPVESQAVYRFGAEVAAARPPKQPWRLELRFFDAENKDIAITEAGLGIPRSTVTVSTPAGWNGTRITLRGEGVAGGAQLNAVRAALFLILPDAATATVDNAGIMPGNSGSAGESAGIEFAHPESGFRFGTNPVPNPAFEEGDGDQVAGWRYAGRGSAKLSADTISGKRALALPQDGDRWESDYFPLGSRNPVRLFYWTKFSRHATPGAHTDPVKVEFFCKDAHGERTRLDVRLPYFRHQEWSPFFGGWFPVLSWPIPVPPGANEARLAVVHEDKLMAWNGLRTANWGELLIDNVMLYQAPEPEIPLAMRYFPYAALVRSFLDGAALPFLPVGNRRENSVAAFPLLNKESNLFFKEDGKAPAPAVGIANLLGISRTVEYRGAILDADEKGAGTFRGEVRLSPYGYAEQKLPVGTPKKFGAYYVDLKFYDNGRFCGSNPVRFGWLEHRPGISDAEKAQNSYLFDMHPSGIGADYEQNYDRSELEFQMGLMRLLGVRGLRLQSRFHGLDLDSPEESAAGARRKVALWREKVLPLMKKYNLRGWVSMMEQGTNNLPRLPKNDRELAAWRAYVKTQAEAFGADIDLMLFGNEGLGHHTANRGCDVPLFRYSAWTGTVRDWMSLYREAYHAAKAGNPQLPFGPGHASDPQGEIARQFFEILGKDAPLDCWAFNAYGDTAQMGERIGAVIEKNASSPVFGIVPEVGLEVQTNGPTRAAGERRQAQYVVQTYLATSARAPWIRRIAYFTMREAGDGSRHTLFDKNWGPRPSAVAYATMTDRLGAGRVEKRIELPGGGEFFLWRRSDGSVVGVGSSETGRSITLDTDAATLCVDDLYGNRETVAVTGGTVGIQLGPEPKYVTGARRLDESKQFVIRPRNLTRNNAEPAVGLEVVNNSGRKTTLTVNCTAHPLVRFSPAERRLTLNPGESQTVEFGMKFLRRDDRRRTPVKFEVTTDDGKIFRSSLVHTFAACVKAPAGFRLDDPKGWERAAKLHADRSNQVQIMGRSTWKGPDDLSAVIRTMWDETCFYLEAEVRDDVHSAQSSPEKLFTADGLELGFDLDYRLSGAATLHQICIGNTGSGPAAYRHRPAPAGKLDLPAGSLMIRATGENGNTLYRIALPWRELEEFRPAPGREIAFGVIIDDSDGAPGDRKFISWFGGGISSSQPQQLGDLVFTE